MVQRLNWLKQQLLSKARPNQTNLTPGFGQQLLVLKANHGKEGGPGMYDIS